MKKVNLFLVGLVTLVTLSVGFSSCGGGGYSNSKISDMFEIVSEGYKDHYGVTYEVKLKNISSKTLDGTFRVKVKLKDGTSDTETCFIKNMEPNEIQSVTIHIGGATDTYNVSSWSFIEE
jgi:hypothetical protein